MSTLARLASLHPIRTLLRSRSKEAEDISSLLDTMDPSRNCTSDIDDDNMLFGEQRLLRVRDKSGLSCGTASLILWLTSLIMLISTCVALMYAEHFAFVALCSVVMDKLALPHWWPSSLADAVIDVLNSSHVLGGDRTEYLLDSSYEYYEYVHAYINFETLTMFLVLFIVGQIMGLFSWPETPQVYYNRSKSTEAFRSSAEKIESFVNQCSIMHEKYTPPWLFGRSGHYQTVSYGVLGRVTSFALANTRHSVALDDGSTVTFDVFEPSATQAHGGNYTLAICPGIANSSESAYVRTLVKYTQTAGYRCAVLNHLGALKNVPLTSRRIFNYGSTDEYRHMILRLAKLYPHTRFLCLGFSMGANIVTKYLSQGPSHPERTVCGLSVCQGYSAISALPVMHQWKSFRRIYLFVMTENMKHVLRDHYDTALAPHVRGGLVNEKQLMSATSLLSFDEYYTRRVTSFPTVEEYYRWCSCENVMEKIDVPMVYLNALDDPLIPESLLMPPRKAAETKPNTIFITTKHGGHLGFLEGSLPPFEVTWLDRFVVQFADAMTGIYDAKHCAHGAASSI